MYVCVCPVFMFLQRWRFQLNFNLITKKIYVSITAFVADSLAMNVHIRRTKFNLISIQTGACASIWWEAGEAVAGDASIRISQFNFPIENKGGAYRCSMQPIELWHSLSNRWNNKWNCRHCYTRDKKKRSISDTTRMLYVTMCVCVRHQSIDD